MLHGLKTVRRAWCLDNLGGVIPEAIDDRFLAIEEFVLGKIKAVQASSEAKRHMSFNLQLDS
jgi:hypothetical protein